MTFVGPEIERYITQHVVFTTRPPALCWQPTATTFSVACIFKIQPFSKYKMTYVGLEPQWYIIQPVFFTTRPLSRCWDLTATFSPEAFSFILYN